MLTKSLTDQVVRYGAFPDSVVLRAFELLELRYLETHGACCGVETSRVSPDISAGEGFKPESGFELRDGRSADSSKSQGSKL